MTRRLSARDVETVARLVFRLFRATSGRPRLLGILVAAGLAVAAVAYFSRRPASHEGHPVPPASGAETEPTHRDPESVPTPEPVSRGAAPTDFTLADGWYELHFTTPKYPTRKSEYHGGLDAHLVRLLGAAARTIDLAVYELDLPNVAEALAAAKGRGVRVRVVTDTDSLAHKDAAMRAALETLTSAEVPVVGDRREAIMHHKFTVVDGTYVATGSWNYTTGDTYRLNNHLFLVRSPELAENYTAEFEQMFERHRFGAAKKRVTPHPVVQVGGVRVRNYFAPQERVSEQIIGLVRSAERSIHFLAFSYTHETIGAAMVRKAGEGVEVGGVFETTGSQTKFSEYGKMKEAGLAVLTDGNPYVMHHKVIIVDGRTTLLGSYNFSSSADRENDENVLVVEDAGVARRFEEEYERVVALAKNPPKKTR